MKLLKAVLGIFFLILREPVLDSFLQFVFVLTTYVAHLHFSLLTNLVALLHKLLTPVLCGLWETENDHLAVVLRRDADIRIHDAFLNVLDSLTLPRTDRDRAGIRHLQGSNLIQRHHLSVRHHTYRIKNSYISTSCTDT